MVTQLGLASVFIADRHSISLEICCLISSSSTTNPMGNTAMFPPTPGLVASNAFLVDDVICI